MIWDLSIPIEIGGQTGRFLMFLWYRSFGSARKELAGSQERSFGSLRSLRMAILIG